jgi:release factor glutamine methyltransferase
VRLFVPPGVLPPPSDAYLLADALAAEALPPGARALDLGTGSGVLALAAARLGLETTAVDVSRRAVLAAKLNARRAGVRVRVLRGDLLAPVAGETFHAIVSNPPYLPATSDELPARGVPRATDAGTDGRALVRRIAWEAPAHLAPGGVLVMVLSSLCGEAAVLDELRAGGLEPEVTERRRGPLGPRLMARAEELERRGLLAPGEREEDLLVVRAYAAGSGASTTGTPKRFSASPITSSSL